MDLTNGLSITMKKAIIPKALHSKIKLFPTGFRISCENDAILAGAFVFVVCDITGVGSPSPIDVDAVTYSQSKCQ